MTKKAYTYEILDGYCMNNGKINVEYLAEQIYIVCYNDVRTNGMARNNKRIKIRNIAINWLMFFVNTELKFSGYSNYYCTNRNLTDYDREHDGGLEKVLDIVEGYIKEIREEE